MLFVPLLRFASCVVCWCVRCVMFVFVVVLLLFVVALFVAILVFLIKFRPPIKVASCGRKFFLDPVARNLP